MCEEITTLETEEIQPKKFSLTARDTVFSVLLFISSILMSALGVFGGFRGGFTVTTVITSVIITVYLLHKGCKFSKFSLICFILSLGVASVFIVTSNGAVRFWGIVTYFCLSITWFTSLTRSETERNDIGFFRFVFSPVFIEGISNIPTVFLSLFSKKENSNKTFGKVFAGFVLSVPVLIIVLPLLINSDEAFSGMVNLVFQQTVTIVLRAVVGLIIGIFLISYAVTLKKTETPLKKELSFGGIEPVIIISFLTVLSVCYLSYLFSQLAYFFDAFSGFLPDGYKFTVSDYARRGFFEMNIIAAINFVVIFLCRFLTMKENKKLILFVNLLCTFIGLFTLIIISTAISKMFLYIESFGMTKLRITTSVFMIFLGVVFIATMIRLYTEKINVIKTAFITAAVAIIILGTFNVNNVVAKYNYETYKKGILKSIDVETIAELDDEGIPYLIKLTNDNNVEVIRYARYKLSLAYEDYFELDYHSDTSYLEIKKKTYNELGQYSFSRQKAYEELEKYLKKDPNVLEYKNEYNNFESYEYY